MGWRRKQRRVKRLKTPTKRLLFKAAISLGLIVALLVKVDLAGFWRSLRAVDPLLFGFSCFLLAIQQVLMAVSWGVLLRAKDARVPYRQVIYAHVVGNFFGTFMPTSLAIDAVRAYSLSRYLKSGVDAASSIFVVRAAGFLVLFILALVFAIPIVRMTGRQDFFWGLLIIFSTFLSAIIAVYYRRTYELVEKFCRFVGVKGIFEKLHYFRLSLLDYSRRHLTLIYLAALTVVYQILGIVVVYLIGLSLNISTPLSYYFSLLPVITVITIAPVSIAGLGVRESSFVYLFSMAGATPAQAFSLSLLMFFQSLLMALAGGLAYWTRGSRMEPKPVAASEALMSPRLDGLPET